MILIILWPLMMVLFFISNILLTKTSNSEYLTELNIEPINRPWGLKMKEIKLIINNHPNHKNVKNWKLGLVLRKLGFIFLILSPFSIIIEMIIEKVCIE